MDQLKKMHVSVSMWDSLSLLGQKDLLKNALSNISLSQELPNEKPKVVLSNAPQEKKGEQQTQKVKPPPFYLTLIIGQHLVHNCMIDSGVSSSIMPKKIVDKLGLTYEPLSEGVVQLDGPAVNTVGVIKNLDLILHACPNFSIRQDVYIIDLPPYFALCLSRDFKAKLGGYLSSDWSHMFFRTIYGTKVTIKLELLANDHIEPYIPSVVNANLSIQESNEQPDIPDPNTPIEGIPDVVLDEWVVENDEEDPFNHMEELELGVYMIHEEGVVVPNLEKDDNQLSNQQGEQQNNELWQLYFDGSRNKVGSGGGVILISPEGKKYFSALRFSFSCTNNTVEYESLAHGLEWARKRNIKDLQVFGDNELVVNQVRGVNVTKNDFLKMYKHRIWDLIEEFDAFNLLSVPRNRNKEADKLVALGAQFDILDEVRNIERQQYVKVVVRPSIPDNSVN